jgi:hypothetical protein
VNAGIVAATLLLPVLGALWLFGGGADAVNCIGYEFDPEKWASSRDAFDGADDRAEEAEDLVRCDTLIGKSRSEVAELLSEELSPGAPRARINAGWVNAGLGPGDGQMMTLHFDSSGRVVRAELLYN